MNCCKDNVIEKQFDKLRVANKISQYRSKGISRETRILVDSLKSLGIDGYSLLDIGCGLGMIGIELLESGLAGVENIEASSSYLESAKTESKRRNLFDKTSFTYGNFVEIAESVSAADIVTLDKVICCYDELEPLVKLSCEKTLKYCGVIYPRDSWWAKAAIGFENLMRKIKGNTFRVFVYPTEEIDSLIKEQGLTRVFYKAMMVWQIVIYSRIT
ncbi:methyltransferase domain-containing protein [Bacteroidota bacterium]